MTLLECQMNCPSIFSQLEVLVDSGIRRGSDVLKCLCLGATAVGLGRPFLYASNYGQEGVEHLIDIIKTELMTAMALIGITDVTQCEPGLVSTLDLDHLVPRGEGHPYATGRRLENSRDLKARL
jgi:L-lactate dehydrogenase (cytochrome)